ncbi:hypothetical protein RI367_002034 [Sorochytrium milnesiophthora]
MTTADNSLPAETKVDMLPSQAAEEIVEVPPPPPAAADESSAKKPAEKTPQVPVYQLWRFASRGDALLITIGVLASIVTGGIQPGAILILGQVLGNFRDMGANPTYYATHPDAVLDMVMPAIRSFCYIGCAMLVGGYLANWAFVLSGERQAKRIRELYFKSILRQDLGWFDKAEEGSLTTRLALDTQQIQDGISERAGMCVETVAQFITGFVIAFIKGWKLALVLLASLPVLGIVGSLMVMAITRFTTAGQNAYADAGAVAEQVVAGIRTVYSFSLQDRFKKLYAVQLDKAYQSDLRKGRSIGMGFGSFMGVMFCTYGLAFWYGAQLVIKDEMDGSQVMVVFFAMLMGAMALIILPPNMSAVATARGAAHKIFAVIDRAPPIDSSSTAGEQPKAVEGELTFSNVRFTYPSRPDVPILKSLSLTIRPGTSVAFVGPSGSGKSTSVSLVQRLYDPLDGTVSLDGRDLRSLNTRWLRQQIGVVSQEPVLFNTTIAENIRLGAAGRPVTQEDVEAACRLANCHDFISKLPLGYETHVGEHGGMLSGGQKQRIAIARALIKNPKILLLDEATSALDSTSERIVQAAIDAATKNRTTIIIAHRLSTIRNADLIVVMAKGELVESGTHNELLALGGVYYEMVQKQKIKTQQTAAEGGAVPLDDESESSAALEDLLKNETVAAPATLAAPDKAAETAAADTRIAMNKSGAGESIELLDKPAVPPLHVDIDEAEAHVKAPYGRVVRMMKPDWPLLALGVLGACVAGCVFPLFGYTLATNISTLTIVDKSQIAPGPFQGANLYAFYFVIIGICAFIFINIQIWSFETVGARMTRRMRATVFDAMLRQEIGFYDLPENSLGALTSRLALDAANVTEMVTKVWGDLVQLVATAVCGLLIAFTHSWQITLLVLCVAPFIVAAQAFEVRIHRGYEDKTKKAYEKTGEVAAEAIKAIRTVAALTQEGHFYDRFVDALAAPHKLAEDKAYKSSIGHGARTGFNQFANAIGFYAGIKLILAGHTTFPNMFVSIMAVMLTASGLGRSSTFTSALTKARISAIKTFALLDRVTEIDPDAPGEVPDNFDGTFDFKDIAFTYPARPDQPIFSGNFNLSGRKRQTIALVGPSGCGKSTTIGMLQRWYNPVSGTIDVDGRNIRDYQLQRGLRSNMALVGQEPVLFDMTIRENIMAGTDRTDVPEAELDEVTKMANINTFIRSLPNGYDTRVGDKGGQLSGGQKQRIAIARALIRKPKLLLLDEATSALDSESEALVQKAIDVALQGRTTVTIAHRLSTIQNADAIAVVRDGRVIELGTHFELLKLNGLYAELVNQQNLNAN